MNDKKMIDFCLWFFALCVFVILITSCSPYMPATATPSQAATEIKVLSWNFDPIPHYWQLAALDPWRVVVIANHKAGH